MLKEAHDLGLSKKAMEAMNSFVYDFLHRILKEARIVQSYSHKVSLSAREIQTATRLILPNEISRHCVSEGGKAVNKYMASLGQGSGSKSSRAGLIMPVGRIARYIKEFGYADRVGTGAPIYLSAVLQWLTHEVLEMAGKIVEDQNRKRIEPRHIMLAVMNDDEFSILMEDVCIPYSGGIPDEPKKKKSKNSMDGNDNVFAVDVGGDNDSNDLNNIADDEGDLFGI